jgi:hypothetical protein
LKYSDSKKINWKAFFLKNARTEIFTLKSLILQSLSMTIFDAISIALTMLSLSEINHTVFIIILIIEILIVPFTYFVLGSAYVMRKKDLYKSFTGSEARCCLHIQ